MHFLLMTITHPTLSDGASNVTNEPFDQTLSDKVPEDNSMIVGRNVTIKPFDQEVFMVPISSWPGEGQILKVVTEHIPDTTRSIHGTVAFSVLYAQKGNQWQLKIREGARNRAEKNLCGSTISTRRNNSLSISAYSDVSHNLTFNIKAVTVTDFTMTVNETRNVTGITPDAPKVIRF